MPRSSPFRTRRSRRSDIDASPSSLTRAGPSVVALEQRSVVRRAAGARSLMGGKGSASFALPRAGAAAAPQAMAPLVAMRRVSARGRSFAISWCRDANGRQRLVFPHRAVASNGVVERSVVVAAVANQRKKHTVKPVPTPVLDAMVRAVSETAPPRTTDALWTEQVGLAADAQALLRRYLKVLPSAGLGEPRELLAHAADMWGLVNALWGDERPAQGGAAAHPPKRRRTAPQRREAAGLWLASLLQAEQPAPPGGDDEATLRSILAALSIGALDLALERAQRFPRLATLIARAGVESMKSRVDGLDGAAAHIVALLAGRPPLCIAASESRPGWACPDWKRGFAMHMWCVLETLLCLLCLLYLPNPSSLTSHLLPSCCRYCTPNRAASLGESVVQFKSKCADRACAPWYAERKTPTRDGATTCTMWRLLAHYAAAEQLSRASRPVVLEWVSSPASISPNVLDVSLPWHLWHALASLGSGRAMPPGAHAAYAAQLEDAGLWHHALVILLHIDPVVAGSPHVREAALREVVRRNCPSTPNVWRDLTASTEFETRCDKLVQQRVIERAWKLEAIADRARAESAWRMELSVIIEMLAIRPKLISSAALCARAHAVVIERVLPILDELAKAQLLQEKLGALQPNRHEAALRTTLDRLKMNVLQPLAALLRPYDRPSLNPADEEGATALYHYLNCSVSGFAAPGGGGGGGAVDRSRTIAVCAELGYVMIESSPSHQYCHTPSTPRSSLTPLLSLHHLSLLN